MDLLAEYASDSDSSSSASDGNEREMVNADKNLNAGAVRQVYLVTYSQADVEQFPTRRSFAEAVVGCFTQSTLKFYTEITVAKTGFKRTE